MGPPLRGPHCAAALRAADKEQRPCLAEGSRVAGDNAQSGDVPWYNHVVGGAHVIGGTALKVTGKAFGFDGGAMADEIGAFEDGVLPGGLPSWARSRPTATGAAPSSEGEGKKSAAPAWWQGRTPTTISLEVLTPPARPGKTEGLRFSKELESLQTAWRARSEFDLTPLGEKVGVYFRDAQGFAYFDDPKGSGVRPIQSYPVLASGPREAAGVTLYVPIAGGPRAGGVYYAAVRLSPDGEEPVRKPAPTAARKAQGAEGDSAPAGPVAWELTIHRRGAAAFTAKSSSESAAADGPHPGVSLVEPGLWERVVGASTRPQDLGLPKRLLAREPDGTIHAAVDEFKSLMAAAQDPECPAQAFAWAVLQSLGITPSGPPPNP